MVYEPPSAPAPGGPEGDPEKMSRVSSTSALKQGMGPSSPSGIQAGGPSTASTGDSVFNF